MAAKYHVNPTTGKTSACEAAVNKCPFGDASEHYPSREAAQNAYEASQRNNEVPTPAKKSEVKGAEGLRQRDLRLAVKGSADTKLLSKAAKEGDEGVLRELALNANTPHDAIKQALQRSQNGKTQELLQQHRNFTKRSYTLKEIDAMIADTEKHGELATFVEGHATDSLVRKISTRVGPDSPLQKVILTSGNEQISHSTKVQALQALALQSPSHLPEDVVASKNFHVEEFVGDMSPEHQHWVASNAKKPETLTAVAKVAVRELEGEYPATANDLAVAVYRNEATSDAVKNRLVKASSSAASYHKLSEVRAYRFPEYQEAMRYERMDRDRPISAGEREHFAFDASKVKNLGLDGSDLQVYMRHMDHRDLYDETYDEETGILSGRRLFGDPDA